MGSAGESARNRSRERLEERERVILDAATTLFATAGFNGTSTRKIAAEAGVSEGTIFHYFGSKNDLITAILDRLYNDQLNPGAAAILDTIMATEARLRALADHHVMVLTADNALMLRLLQVYLESDLGSNYGGTDVRVKGDHEGSPLRDLNRSYVGFLDRTVREGIERGELRPDLKVRSVRDLFFGTLEYGLRTHLLRHGQTGLRDYLDELLAPILRGIAVTVSPTTNTSNTERDRSTLDRLTPDRLTLDRLTEACERLEEVATRLEDAQQGDDGIADGSITA
ncbi:MAG: TetR/AcrR family transcriptional regulator [Pseudomonadota bacterium]